MRTRHALQTLGVAALSSALGCEPERGASPRPAVETAPAPTRSSRLVSGRVSVNGGQAAAGDGTAEVCALYRGPRVKVVREDLLRRCATTGAGGHYELALPPGVWMLVASARGQVSAGKDLVLRAGEPNASVDFGLRRGGAERVGRLVDLDGAPLAGVRIAARKSFGSRLGTATSVETDAEGQFALWTTVDASLVVESAGYLEDMVVEAPGSYTALPESVIEGRVIDETGSALAGVRVAYVDAPLDPPLGKPNHATLTDTEGRFHLGGVRFGHYRLMAFRDTLAGTKKIDVEFAHVHANVEIVVKPTLEWLHAQVIDGSGEPVAGCLISLQPAGGSPAWGSTFFSDEEGGVAFPNRPGASFDVVLLNCPGKVGKPPYAPLSSTEHARLEVGPGHRLRGRVQDGRGQALAHLKVTINEKAAEPMDPPDTRFFFSTSRVSTMTDGDGRFEIPGLFAGAHELSVEGEYARLPVLMTAEPTTEGSFTVERSAPTEPSASTPQHPPVIARIVDETGKGVGRALVSLRCGLSRVLTEHSWSLHANAVVLSDARGQLRVEPGCDPSEPFVVTAARPGMFASQVVEPGHSAAITIELRRLGQTKG